MKKLKSGMIVNDDLSNVSVAFAMSPATFRPKRGDIVAVLADQRRADAKAKLPALEVKVQKLEKHAVNRVRVCTLADPRTFELLQMARKHVSSRVRVLVDDYHFKVGARRMKVRLADAGRRHAFDCDLMVALDRSARSAIRASLVAKREQREAQRTLNMSQAKLAREIRIELTRRAAKSDRALAAFFR